MKKVTLFLTAIVAAGGAYSLELTSGVLQEFGMEFTEDQRAALTVVTSEVEKAASRYDEGISLAFLRLDETDNWFRIYSNMALYGVDVSKPKYLGSWLIDRWDHEFIEDEVDGAFYYGRQWPGTRDYFGDLAGCMAKSPLRYGDVTGNGQPEIVIFLPDEFTLDMLVFSPSRGEVIFSSPMYTTNSITIGEADQSLVHPDPERRYQYYLRSGQVIAGMGGSMTAAIRGYGKIYTGDFNENGKQDLLLWRKLYRSLPVSSETAGFESLAEVWLHYAMLEGEYQQQETSESVIQGWLAANDLTWQKGFPTYSECPDEEGQLIPEMHDPLLNDPDVLQ